MALRAEGAAALDCFEVTLKCEEGEDDEEAVVVAVIPRPEPMLRGEGGNLTSAWWSGTRSPVPSPLSPGASLLPSAPPEGPSRSVPRLGRTSSSPTGLESQASRSPPSSAAPPPLRV